MGTKKTSIDIDVCSIAYLMGTRISKQCESTARNVTIIILVCKVEKMKKCLGLINKVYGTAFE